MKNVFAIEAVRHLLLSGLPLFLAAGCYTDRMTGNYSDLLASSNLEDAAVLEVSGDDPKKAAKDRARLEDLKYEAEPTYRINAGDRIQVKVYGHDDLCVTTKVSPDGSIGMLFLGHLQVSGYTIGEAAEVIKVGLEPYVKHPVVGVTVLDIASETITISGACEHPGIYNISSATRLADVYAMAGGSGKRLFNGVDVDVADLEHSVVVRGEEILPVNFTLAIDEGDPLHNIRLQRGDYIHIAQRMESSVTICGDVNNPHRRLYETGMGLIETLTAAGWMKDTHWSHVIIIRDGLKNPKMYKVDVDGILAGKCRNVKLQKGDIIYVPKDNLSEYNVFVNKLLPTAQIINLMTSRVSAFSL